MARITTNTTGTQPVIKIDIVSPVGATAITIPAVQDLTVTNSTGVFSYTTFSDLDTRKLPTPADNEVSTNVVIDTDAWFGVGIGSTAAAIGLAELSLNKTPIYFEVNYSGTAAGSHKSSGTGFITSLAPSVSPDAPVWVSPLTIAVDGGFTPGVNA